MIYPVVIYLIDLAAGRSRELLIATVMACGFLTFYSMPDGMPFLVRPAIMVTTQFALGIALRQADKDLNDEP